MEKDEFYIGYGDGPGKNTAATLKKFVVLTLFGLLIGAFLFAFFQKPAVNSSFDFGNPTKINGIYHESPYPMLRVSLADNTFKDILLLGFGKLGPNPYLKEIRNKEGDLNGKRLQIEGQLVYYNGKTLLEIDDSQKIKLMETGKSIPVQQAETMGEATLVGEVTDPKCYFGVMKPGYGKIHRSCAALCIAGGIPPVLVANDQSNGETYFLLTDLQGKAINNDIVPYIGKLSTFIGQAYKKGDWNILRINTEHIKTISKTSNIYK